MADIVPVQNKVSEKTNSLQILQVPDQKAIKLYNIAKNWSRTNEVTAASVITFCMALISAVENIVKEPQSGPKKKEMVLTVLRLVVENDTPLLEQDKALILSIIDATVPTVIDTAIGIVTGEIDLAQEWNRYFGSCCPCLPVARAPKSNPK